MQTGVSQYARAGKQKEKTNHNVLGSKVEASQAAQQQHISLERTALRARTLQASPLRKYYYMHSFSETLAKGKQEEQEQRQNEQQQQQQQPNALLVANKAWKRQCANMCFGACSCRRSKGNKNHGCFGTRREAS